MIRHYLGDALELKPTLFDVVTSPYDFAGLCNVAAAVWKEFDDVTPEQVEEIEAIRKECLQLNDFRVRIAHGTWIVGPQNEMARHVSRQKLTPQFFFKSPDEVEELADKADEVRQRLVVFFIGDKRISQMFKLKKGG